MTLYLVLYIHTSLLASFGFVKDEQYVYRGETFHSIQACQDVLTEWQDRLIRETVDPSPVPGTDFSLACEAGEYKKKESK